MKKEKKVLQVVNLAPSESWIEKLTEVHPMRQIAYATIIQAVVFFGMLGAFKLIGIVSRSSPDKATRWSAFECEKGGTTNALEQKSLVSERQRSEDSQN